MAVSKLKTIKDFYITALQAINGTAGYTNTVGNITQRTCNRLVNPGRGVAEVFVEIKDTGETDEITYAARPEMCTVEIVGQIMNPLDAANNDAAIFSLRKDVRKAVMADRRCGGAAILVTPRRAVFAYGDPAVEFTMTLEVQYVEDET